MSVNVHNLPINEELTMDGPVNVYMPEDITMGVFGLGDDLKAPLVVIIVDHYPPCCVAKTAEQCRHWAADFTRAAEELEKRAKVEEPK
jgi:hypothetical protein